MLDTTRHRAIPAARFLKAAFRYWIGTYPAIQSEIRRIRRRAERIPDPTLRTTALDSLDRKWSDLEGAGAFAAFVPLRHRVRVTRLLVCVQAIYDYADTLAEQSSDDPQADAIALHSALLDALRPRAQLSAHYAHHGNREDGGYLASLVKRCRAEIAQLPAFALIADAAGEHAQRIVDYQARINHEPDRGHASFATWAESETHEETELLLVGDGRRLRFVACAARAARRCRRFTLDERGSGKSRSGLLALGRRPAHTA